MKVDVENDSYFCKKIARDKQILIDQNRSEILEESMRCSFLVKFDGFSLQLYYKPNSFTGIVLVFFYFFSKKHPSKVHSFASNNLFGCFKNKTWPSMRT